MLIDYLRAAMHHARYEILDDGEGYYGEISECPGVLFAADDLESCRNQLWEVLEDWVLFRVSQGLSIPAIDGRSIEIREVA
jgi:predicted RNase H-like HicB family nuclease